MRRIGKYVTMALQTGFRIGLQIFMGKICFFSGKTVRESSYLCIENKQKRKETL